MAIVTRYLGPEVPKEQLVWQDPIPALNHAVVDAKDIAGLKASILASGLSVSDLVYTAWSSASTFRGSDRRGGANGARINLMPMKTWSVNEPKQLDSVLRVLGKIQKEFNGKSKTKKISLADMIVLGGSAAVEKAAKDAGYTVQVKINILLLNQFLQVQLLRLDLHCPYQVDPMGKRRKCGRLTANTFE